MKKKSTIVNESNDFFSESKELFNDNKYSRRYSNMYKAVSSVAYIFGPKCYEFFKKYYPLPHETLLRRRISPIINKYVENLIDIKKTEAIINEFLHETISENNVHATLAIEVSGETVLQ